MSVEDEQNLMDQTVTEDGRFTEQAIAEINISADMISRILGGRAFPVCMEAMFLVIEAMAGSVPKEGRDYLALKLRAFADRIEKLESEESEDITRTH